MHYEWFVSLAYLAKASKSETTDVNAMFMNPEFVKPVVAAKS